MNANLKKLIEILSDGFFHSGTDLGKRLGLTRGGIWKLIQQMEVLGISIDSRTNKGYQIIDGLELLSLNEINQYISPRSHSLIHEIILLDEISSTNDYLSNYSTLDGKAVICVAENQTAGRGRFGRKWLSPFASNLYLSLLWSFPMDVSQLAGLSLCIGVSLVKALNRYGISEQLNLKWPNDVLWQGKKLAGCLIETRGEAYGTCHTIIGIGLNVNMPNRIGHDIQGNWIDIRNIIHNLPQRNRLTGLILNSVLETLPIFQSKGLQHFKKAWEDLNISSNKSVSVMTPDGILQGIDRGIDTRGNLLLQTEKEIHTFSSGEVSLKLF